MTEGQKTIDIGDKTKLNITDSPYGSLMALPYESPLYYGINGNSPH